MYAQPNKKNTTWKKCADTDANIYRAKYCNKVPDAGEIF
jgi:hypothetical protein